MKIEQGKTSLIFPLNFLYIRMITVFICDWRLFDLVCSNKSRFTRSQIDIKNIIFDQNLLLIL
ncbi:hypothetical protein BpHYR1_007939 [Brachionus plicatilis]|uniref:Uncharacterized protein n=1 Tax=Brachionus plicatilis TaxID=10195 RepID=A0A3M7R1C3_BRAPC|nr:hypothetical protein BpHYR1_007939 [Brachionus plicatilis]